MYSLLLAIIYIAFISLGLPDSLLGSAWPVMQSQMNVPLSYAGAVTMLIAAGTIISSLLSDRLTKKAGAALITAVSVLMTAIALLGFSLSTTFPMLLIWSIPYGLGAGAIDAALNNYVALHYASRHMNWLHCFWGVGAAISPYIMGQSLTSGLGWNTGYRTVAIIQIAITALLFISLPLWKKHQAAVQNGAPHMPPQKLPQILKIRGVKYVLLAFFAYCALESTTGLWASSYLVLQRGVTPETAAKYASLFFLGITAGRFLSGFVSNKIGDKNMIKTGIAILIIGIIAVSLPIKTDQLALTGLVTIGVGCAPIYPAIIHSTPRNFGAENSQAIIGVQMASAYTGSTLAPPIFGLIANNITVALYPAFLLIFAALMLLMTTKLNGVVASNQS